MLNSRMITLLVPAVLIVSLLSGCGSSPSDSPAVIVEAGNAPTVTPTVTGASGNTIMLTGGGGPKVVFGGMGGYWGIETYSVKGVSMKLSGIAPAAFTVPAYNPVPDFGANLTPVVNDTTVPLLPYGASAPFTVGALYQVSSPTGDYHLYRSHGTGTVPNAADIVTGLTVYPGVTLTLSLNWDGSNSDGDNSNATGQDRAYVVFPNDVNIMGTVTVKPLTTAAVPIDQRHGAPALALDTGDLYISAAQVFVQPGGSLLTAGLPAYPGTFTRGGDGGQISVAANNFAINAGTLNASGGEGDNTGPGGNGNQVSIQAMNGTGPGNGGGGVVVNKGKILASGGEGGSGGAGGGVLLAGHSHVFNTGPITAPGGKGNAGPGGPAGGTVLVYSEYASVFNSGAISDKGGDGYYGGGAGGTIALVTGPTASCDGDAANTGVLDASGGNAIPTISSSPTGTGGTGGYIDIGGYQSLYVHGAIRNSGSLIANGGDHQGAGIGGPAGTITLWNAAGRDYGQSKYGPVKAIQLSGNIGLRGGTSYTGGNGGKGGNLYIRQNMSPDGDLSQGGIQLMGYSKADLSGGSGTSFGGNATLGAMYVYTYADSSTATDALGNEYLPVGPIYNELAISAKGGDGTGSASRGGGGGMLTWTTRSSPTNTNPADSWASNGTSVVTNKGAIDVSGGSGGINGGGNSGGIIWYGHDGLTNSGSLMNKGGNSTGGKGGQGAYWHTNLYSSLDVVNSGAINTTGGSGVIGGDGSDMGPAWRIRLYAGGQVRNSGAITANGGASTTGKSGNGGYVDIMSETKPTQNAASISVVKGATTKGTQGVNGQIWVDWVDVTPTDGTLP